MNKVKPTLGLLGGGCLIVGFVWLFAGSNHPPAKVLPPDAGRGRVELKNAKPLPTENRAEFRIGKFRKWLAGGGAKTADRDRVVDDFYRKIADEDNLPPEHLLELILTEFPPELRGYYALRVLENVCRKNPLEGAKFLSSLPPGEILRGGVEMISARAGEKGVDTKDVLAWANTLDYPEDREFAVRRFVSGKNWSGISLTDLQTTLSLFSSNDVKRLVSKMWLDAGGQPGDLAAIGDPTLLSTVKDFYKLQDAIAGSAHPAAESTSPIKKPTEDATSPNRSIELSEKGVAAYAERDPDFGYQRLLTDLADNNASPDETRVITSGWYWTLVQKNIDAALAVFEENPNFKDSGCVSALTQQLLGTDRERMREWISSPGRDPAFIKQVMVMWLEADSLKASEWVGQLSPGDLREAAVTATADWLRKKGDIEASKQWDKAPVQD